MTASQEVDPELLLGRIAVERKLVTAEALEACVAEQTRRAAGGLAQPLGEVLVERGLVSREQLDHVLKAQMFAQVREADVRFGQLAVKNAFASRADVDRCLRLQEETFESRREVVLLGRLMLDGRLLTEQQVEALLKAQNRLKERGATGTGIACPFCSSPIPPDSRFCGECRREVPETPRQEPMRAALCPQCGLRFPASHTFCPACSKPLEMVSAVARRTPALLLPTPGEGQTPPASPRDLGSTSKIQLLPGPASPADPSIRPPTEGGLPGASRTRGADSRRLASEPEVSVELETSRTYRQHEASTLWFRLTNGTDRRLKVVLEVGISYVDLAEREGKIEFTLAPRAVRHRENSSFKPKEAGTHNLASLRMTVEYLEENDRPVDVYVMTQHGIELSVCGHDTPPGVMNVTIQGGVEVFGGDFLPAKADPTGRRPNEDEKKARWDLVPFEIDPRQTDQERERRKSHLKARRGAVIVSGPSRKKATEVMLTWAGTPHGCRVFCLASMQACFGRDDVCRRDGPGGFILRALPYRADDPKDPNWSRTKSISRRHCSVMVDAQGRAYVRDCESTHGTRIGGVRIEGRDWTPLKTDAATFELADGAMELDMRVYRAGFTPQTQELDSVARHGDANGAMGIERPGFVDAVRFRRLANLPEHAYLLLQRQAYIGSNPGNAIVVDDPLVAPIHARLIYYHGEFFVTSAGGAVIHEGRTLAANEHLPLAPGGEFSLGGVAVKVAAPSAEDFKSV